jgi:hypothetical protein
MSGYTEHPAVHQAAGGGHGFLQKPFKPEALVRTVRERLDSHRGALEPVGATA